jgi:amino acid adenylation domain-containing protein/thioester reductase-like protein
MSIQVRSSVPGIHRLLDDLARAHPGRPALLSDEATLSLGDWVARANRMAWALRRNGVVAGTPVGVHLERSLDWAAAVLAVLKAGGAYVPLDAASPAQRLGCILEDARPAVVLSRRAAGTALPRTAARVLPLEEIPLAPGDEGPPPGAVEADGVAFVLFTSGSTGRPKGVLGSHRGLMARCLHEPIPFGPGEVAALKTSIGFIDSLWELFAPALHGAPSVVVPAADLTDPPRFLSRLRRYGVTRLVLVPSLLRALLDAAPRLAEAVPRLRYWVSTGEPLPGDLCARFYSALPDRVLINLYGTTEVWDATWHDTRGHHSGPAPIGRPLPYADVVLLDEARRPVADGAVGEICVGGAGVAVGYLGQPEATRERFVAGGPGVLYRTGDLGRRRTDGAIECLGRADRQVKLRGVRVELGEVESALRRHPAVADAISEVRPGPAGEPCLFAWVTPGTAPDGRRLRAWLKDHLPAAVLPSQIIPLDRFPLTSSGKVDRLSLPGRAPGRRGGGAPQTGHEQLVAAAWAEVLGVEEIETEDDFFELGGDSLSAVKAVARLSEAVGRDISPHTLFQHATLSAFVRAVEANEAAPYPPEELAADAVLEPDFRPVPASPACPPAAANLLLTGATGFLGAYLARDLVLQTRATVYCLVRARTTPEAEQRLHQALARRGLSDRGLDERLVAVPGDFSRPRLGLDAGRYEELAERIDQVLHCGAHVHFLHDYRRLRGANVAGTREALGFAAHRRAKPFHHVSTLAVLDTPGNLGRVVDESERPALDDAPFTGYGQSKLAAEHLVWQVRERGLPVAVYRSDNISGDRAAGVGNPTDFIWLWLKGCVQLGVAPDIDMAEYMAPVDEISRAIVQSVGRPGSLGRTFHLRNPEPLSWSDLVRAAENKGYSIRRVSYAQWQRLMRDLPRTQPDNALAPFTPFFTRPLPRLGMTLLEYYCRGRRPEYKHARSTAAFAEQGTPLTAIDAGLLARHLDVFQRRGYLPDGR